MTETLYHGTGATQWQPYAGACLTPDREFALQYAMQGARLPGLTPTVVTVELDTTHLTHATDLVDEPRDWDDPDPTVWHAAAGAEVDLVSHADQAPDGSQGQCWRLLTSAAVDAATVTGREAAR